jgi:hypothetical protein
MTGEEFACYILPKYRFRREAAELILAGCVFELDDAFSIRGGGWVRFGYGGDKTVVHFNTAQAEAAVHELAHAWWFLIELDRPKWKQWLIDRLLICFQREADKPLGRFPVIREHCRVYKYGDGADFPGMWSEEAGRWNHDEIFAGFASAVMGDMRQMPADLRRIFRHCFWDEFVYLPGVQA